MVKTNNITTIQMYELLTAGMIDTTGYATISNSGSTFVGATVPALASATYDIDITVDGTVRKLAVPLLVGDAWTGICTKIQTALRTATTKLETVAIVDGKIKVSSVTDGATSDIIIAAGTTGSGGGDLLAAIDAKAGYTTVLDAPVDGVEGTVRFQVTNALPSDDFKFNYSVKTTAGLEKSGFISSYSKTTGVLTITDNGTTTEFVAGDEVFVSGVFIKGL